MQPRSDQFRTSLTSIENVKILRRPMAYYYQQQKANNHSQSHQTSSQLTEKMKFNLPFQSQQNQTSRRIPPRGKQNRIHQIKPGIKQWSDQNEFESEVDEKLKLLHISNCIDIGGNYGNAWQYLFGVIMKCIQNRYNKVMTFKHLNLQCINFLCLLMKFGIFNPKNFKLIEPTNANYYNSMTIRCQIHERLVFAEKHKKIVVTYLAAKSIRNYQSGIDMIQIMSQFHPQNIVYDGYGFNGFDFGENKFAIWGIRMWRNSWTTDEPFDYHPSYQILDKHNSKDIPPKKVACVIISDVRFPILFNDTDEWKYARCQVSKNRLPDKNEYDPKWWMSEDEKQDELIFDGDVPPLPLPHSHKDLKSNQNEIECHGNGHKEPIFDLPKPQSVRDREARIMSMKDDMGPGILREMDIDSHVIPANADSKLEHASCGKGKG